MKLDDFQKMLSEVGVKFDPVHSARIKVSSACISLRHNAECIFTDCVKPYSKRMNMDYWWMFIAKKVDIEHTRLYDIFNDNAEDLSIFELNRICSFLKSYSNNKLNHEELGQSFEELFLD